MILIGAGGHAKVVLDAALLAGVEVEMLLDDAPAASSLFGVPIQRRSRDWSEVERGKEFLVAIGDDSARARLFAELLERGAVPVRVVHPRAWLSPHATVGRGVFVAAAAVVNPNSSVGDDCILNTGCSVDHDCRVAEHVHLCPGVRLAGQVTIGAFAMVGTGAVVLPGVQIGERAVIGAGAVVTCDVPEATVVAGVPARMVRRIESGGLPR